MYNEFFGLDDAPFTLTPDPRFMVFTPSYNEVLARLYYGLENGKGLVVVTGEVGTGKTTAMRWALRRLDSSVLAAYLVNPRLSIDEFYQSVTQLLGIKEWSNKSELLSLMGRVLEERHRRGLKTVIIIDEAHELTDYVLEEIRLLLNFESDNAKHLQIVLTGQPELRDKLNQANLRQLKQRVALRALVHALPNAGEVKRYITERLSIAGCTQPDIFTPDAIEFIFQCSEGIPRNINNLCENALLAAYSASEKMIGRKFIEDVAENLDMLPRKDYLNVAEPAQAPPNGRVFQDESRDEMWNAPSDVERPKPVFRRDSPSYGNPNGHSKGQSNGHSNGLSNGYTNGHSNGYSPSDLTFEDLDDDLDLELGPIHQSFGKYN